MIQKTFISPTHFEHKRVSFGNSTKNLSNVLIHLSSARQNFQMTTEAQGELVKRLGYLTQGLAGKAGVSDNRFANALAENVGTMNGHLQAVSARLNNLFDGIMKGNFGGDAKALKAAGERLKANEQHINLENLELGRIQTAMLNGIQGTATKLQQAIKAAPENVVHELKAVGERLGAVHTTIDDISQNIRAFVGHFLN